MSYAATVLTEQMRECVRRRLAWRARVGELAFGLVWGAILATLLCLGVK